MRTETSVAEVGDIPRNFVALRQAIIERKDKLPKRLAQIATFSLVNPDEIAFGTVAGVAQLAQVQP